MSQFNIDEIEKRTLSGLKDFQRATVERVDYLFRHNQNRVLVADEVGMGKTLIARGAIVKTARLRIEEKDDLFKVIYICSNQNIANQNIRKLDVTGKNAIGSVSDTRLSMQHLKITEQENDPQIKEGFIQLIPLTPETSFRMTTGGGSVQERALMYAILRRMPDFKGHAASLEKFMIMDAVKAWDGWAKWNFENRVAECEKMTKGVYPQNVIEKILNYQEYESIRDMLLNHLHERRYNKQLTYSNYYVMNKLRVMFARISVSMLEPDLVIMDEFQRFKFLLSSDDSELGILAHSFLSGHDTRVLLLSATPYKLYSTLEEIDENQLDEHYAEFFQVMNFLFDDEVKDIKFKEVWKNYSHALSELKAGDSAIIRMKELAENAMYQGVSRTERISVMDSGDYTDDSSVKHHLQIDENDINSYIQMSRLLSKTDSNHSLPVDYAKSCPYLMSFMKKYKIKEQIEKYYTKYPDEFGSEREQSLLWLNRNKINKYDELPKTNARLEALKEKAFTGGAEKYLWIPPALPYYEMQGAYKNSKGFSKILVFSAWEMVPRMIGALVSYEAERLTVAKVFVNNFNLPESTAIIDLAYGRCRDDNSHWQNVLKYCKDGCFQAMIDEYIHMLKETAGFQSDGNQYQIVHDMMMDSLKIHTATYIADTYPDFKKRINGADRKSDGCRIRSSYAVGFTKDAGDNSKVVMRKENIRNAFNSPMRPFVLATTSIGQEGLDFHNYCRVIMHWNLPSNPIDLEQREGRINRFKCLAIRQNVADKYGKADGITFKRDIWTEMFEAAKAEKQNDQSELVPFWCFGKNQSVKIERLVPMYPMSKDEVNYERLIKILSLYRLTLGQARQEELLEYLFKEFKDTSGLKKLFIDLSPFSKGKEG